MCIWFEDLKPVSLLNLITILGLVCFFCVVLCFSVYSQTSNIRRTKSQSLNVYRLVSQLSKIWLFPMFKHPVWARWCDAYIRADSRFTYSLGWTRRPMSWWRLHMSWRLIGAKPSAITMLILPWLENIIVAHASYCAICIMYYSHEKC